MKTRKVIFTLLFLLSCISVSAFSVKDVFIEGTRWETFHTCCVPTIPDGVTTHLLEGDTIVNGSKCLKLWEISDSDLSTKHLLNVIRTEGEKVFFLPAMISENWALMYDFGLKVGDKCEISFLPSIWNDHYKIITTSVDCIEINGDEMLLKEEKDSLFTGKWIKGVSCTQGFLRSGYFGAIGQGGPFIESLQR